MASSSLRKPRRTPPFEPHPPELAGGPAGDHHRRAEVAAGHGHGAEAVPLAQDDGDQRRGQAGAADEHLGEAAHGGGALGVDADHEAGRVAQGHHRQPVLLADAEEARPLVGRVGVDGAAEVNRVVGDEPHRAPLDAGEAGDQAGAEPGPQLEPARDRRPAW